MKTLKSNNPDALRLLGILREDVFVGPEFLLIDINNFCNLQCLYCWYHSFLAKDKFNKKFEIPFEIFREIVDDSAELRVKEIILSGEGEPFLHSQIEKMIKYIKQKKMNVILATNATFPKNFLKNLVLIDGLSINLSAGSHKVYENVQDIDRRGYFKTVIRNLSFVSKLKERGLTRPKIVINYIINTKNYSDIGNALKLANKFKVDELCFVVMHSDEPFSRKIILSEKSLINFKKIVEELLRKRDLVERVNNNLKEISDVFSNKNFLESGQQREFYSGHFDKADKCYLCWYQAYIKLNGDVKPCCRRGDVNIGNIYNNRFKNIWGSEGFRRVRLSFKNEFDLNKEFWRNCNICRYAQLNRLVENRVKRLESRNVL